MKECNYYQAKGWLEHFQKELGGDNRERTYVAAKAVLHTIRDTLSYEDAMKLAVELPIPLRGIYFEGYRPDSKPRKMDRRRFSRTVAERMMNIDPERATKAVLSMLSENCSEEVGNCINSLSKELQATSLT